VLSAAYKIGLFGFDAIQMCDDAIDSSTAFDVEYYHKLQAELELDDDAMYDYLQQWICVVPPDDQNAYIAAIHSFDADYNHEVYVDAELTASVQKPSSIDSRYPAIPHQRPPRVQNPLEWDSDFYRTSAADELDASMVRTSVKKTMNFAAPD
jgi:hypothetical protein